jgi:hypothetical protein
MTFLSDCIHLIFFTVKPIGLTLYRFAECISDCLLYSHCASVSDRSCSLRNNIALVLNRLSLLPVAHKRQRLYLTIFKSISLDLATTRPVVWCSYEIAELPACKFHFRRAGHGTAALTLLQLASVDCSLPVGRP